MLMKRFWLGSLYVLYLKILKYIYALQVDLTQYLEKHEFVFDAVLNEEVTNDEVSIMWFELVINITYDIFLLL